MMSTTSAVYAPVTLQEDTQHAILFNLESCQVHSVASDVITIGSSQRSTIRITEDWMSSQHCMIIRYADGFRLYDLNSASGCYVNGARVTENCQIFDGDEITVGHATFAFNLVEKQSQFSSKDAKQGFSWVKAFGNYLRSIGRH
jgi:pSer/pThr/pTyr-binding forkhead associated (FHA) protein